MSGNCVHAWDIERNCADLKIISAEPGKEYSVEIVKKAKFPLPLHLFCEYLDGKTETLGYSAEIWKNGEDSTRINLNGPPRKIRMGETQIRILTLLILFGKDKKLAGNAY